MKLKEETLKKKKENTNSKQKQESCVHPTFCGTLGAGGIQKREIRVSSCWGKDCKGEDLQCLQCDRAAGRLSHTFPSSAFLWQEKCDHFPSIIGLRGVRTAMPSAHDLAATKSRPNLTMVRVCAHVCARVFFSLALPAWIQSGIKKPLKFALFVKGSCELARPWHLQQNMQLP